MRYFSDGCHEGTRCSFCPGMTPIGEDEVKCTCSCHRVEGTLARLMHQQRLDGAPDDLVSVTKHGEIKPATARERQLRLF